MKGCTQVVHRNPWTPLYNRGKIVDMIAPVGVLIAATALVSPPTPTLDPHICRVLCVGPDVGRLALLFGDARVDCAVEFVVL